MSAVAQKYSRALFGATESNKQTEVVAIELEQIEAIFLQKDMQAFFASPFNSADTKLMVVKSALEGKCLAETFNFLVLVVNKNRVSQLSAINKAFQTLVRAKSGETEGTLYVAGEITAEFKANVESRLAKVLNKKVKLRVEKDPALLSGYKASIGGWTMDDSAQLHLNKIKEDVLK